jgi:hypothetical protein
MAGLAASVIEIIFAFAIDFQLFQTLPLIINLHGGHYTAWFKFSTLFRKQVRPFAALLIVKLGDWVPLLKT